jgi:hypothetical protein
VSGIPSSAPVAGTRPTCFRRNCSFPWHGPLTERFSTHALSGPALRPEPHRSRESESARSGSWPRSGNQLLGRSDEVRDFTNQRIREGGSRGLTKQKSNQQCDGDQRHHEIPPIRRIGSAIFNPIARMALSSVKALPLPPWIRTPHVSGELSRPNCSDPDHSRERGGERCYRQGLGCASVLPVNRTSAPFVQAQGIRASLVSSLSALVT